ncbi:MAG: ABC transporter substrate-binding protein [Propionibacteriales bacterium]|nr:ABC transporter substrate-binding protein [Propionibacteriales bacterium]
MGVFAALSGDYANLGTNIRHGAQLALDEYNAEHPDCEAVLEEFDSRGSERRAPRLAESVVADSEVIGVVGPGFSGESMAALPTFDEAGLPVITPSATNPSLAEQGWDVFHRMLGNDATQGPAVAQYVADVLGGKKVFLMNDATEYGAALATIIQQDLRGRVIGTDAVQQQQTDFSAAVTAVDSLGADTLVYVGYYAEAARLTKQMRRAGWKGDIVATDGVKDPGYIEAGGAATKGTILTCPCIPPDEAPRFSRAYEKAFGVEPSTYSAEGYDAMRVFLAGLDEGIDNREDMLRFVDDYTGSGLTNRVAFDDRGEPSDVAMWAYRVKKGRIVTDREIE